MQDVIEQYAGGGEKLRRAIAGLSEKELKAFPVAGTWSIQQIVIHLTDSDAIWVSRMKQMIAEDRPLIMGYDESDWAAHLLCDYQSAADAVTLFDLNRIQFARVLKRLPESGFERKGIHSERGEISVGHSLKMMVEHVDHHLKFIYEKRAKLGKPLKD
ncbi:MAG TPA: DinB family protein [Tepidisphaeraceae bacterium]|nr:DinB family protein [Tepidisphaeraceae bacterium]